MKKLVILRGLPGSGKSTKAGELVKKYKDDGNVCVVCSADHFFIKDGEYRFDARGLPRVHALCQGKAEGAMDAGAGVVLIDNTNMRRKDFEYYTDLAKKYGYEVEEVVVGAFDQDSIETYYCRNVHEVSLETIQKMAARFER